MTVDSLPRTVVEAEAALSASVAAGPSHRALTPAERAQWRDRHAALVQRREVLRAAAEEVPA